MIAKSLIQSGKAEIVKIFYSYSRKDSAARDLIEQAVASFDWDINTETWKRDQVQQWYDEGLQGGDKWDPDIKLYLNNADIILLFITQNFFESNYIKEVELRAALSREKKGEAKVIPILIEKTDPTWLDSDFGYLQPLPKNCLPINEWINQSEALISVSQGIVDIIVNEGLAANSRTRWQIHLDEDIAQFNQESKRRLIENFRRISNDDTVRFLKTNSGSVILTMESTKEGFVRIDNINKDGNLGKEIGYPILRIFELLGAQIQEGILSPSNSNIRPEKLPDPELILLPSEQFGPVLLKGLLMDKDDPQKFEFLSDAGSNGPDSLDLKSEVSKVIEYFITAITTPKQEMFVNLAPEKNAVLLPETLKDTRLGLDLLEFDFRLKRLSASLLHPDFELGKEFWLRVIDKIDLSESPINAFQRVWIYPEEAKYYAGTKNEFFEIIGSSNLESVKESDYDILFLVDHQLKVLTEKIIDENEKVKNSNFYKTNEIIHEIFEELVVPVIQKEVNEGKNFASVRQIHASHLLAIWIKDNRQKFPMLEQFIDCKNPNQLGFMIQNLKSYNSIEAMKSYQPFTFKQSESTVSNNINFVRPTGYEIYENKVYYDKYMEVFKNGVFYLERYDYDKNINKKVPRVYFAGGIDFRNISTKT